VCHVTGLLSEEERDQIDRAATKSRTLALTRLSDVETQKIEWLWSARIPKGKVTLLVGDPGAGKSFISLAIAANVTTGAPLPGGERHDPQSVLIWNGEDGTADTIRPRSEAAGANLERVYVIEGETTADGTHLPFGLASIDLLIEYVAAAADVGLVIVDPLAALLAGVDAHRDAEIRSSLQPLADFAERFGVAILVIAHLNKRDAERALYRVGGSIGFVGLARSVLLAAVDPEDGRRAIAPLKCNLAAMPAPIEYRIDEEGRFWWGAASGELTADHLLRSVRPERYGGARTTAERFLRDVLANGPVPAKDLILFAEDRGINSRTIERARRDLGVRSVKQGKEWVLCLPEIRE
jgi:putative DNA primase/helicase